MDGILDYIWQGIQPSSLLQAAENVYYYAPSQVVDALESSTPGASLAQNLTGHLSQSQKQTLQDQGDADITKAAAGNQQLADSQIALWHHDLNTVLDKAKAQPLKTNEWLFIAGAAVLGVILVVNLLT